ncbi:MAG: S8 family serine peptidase, partial [archaeon]|nr:S8 family serine peptidase [archaeon]
MKKFIFAFFVVFILIISFVLGATRNEDFSESLSQKSLEKSLRANGEVRVIIKFNNPEEKNAFNSAKKDIQTVIGKNKIKHDFGDSITLDVNSKDLENLKKNKNIESITLIPSKKLFLQDSVPLINATLAWNLQVNGFNLTGSGETVCIIDTGVNYTHLDLGGCFGNNNVSSNCKIIGGWNTLADNNNTMDVQGHGTHVSGIVAANGTINGVAKNAKIIMMMAYNSSAAVFYDDDLKEAIDWCVSNSSVFNISVISMSLGGGSYSSSCDYQDDPLNLTDSIHSATAKNISVVVATGNDYSTTDIASPSCVSGVIPVGSTDKSDVISTFSNTNSLVKLLAPGENINSTCITGGYCLMSGTSMATPHVAGAILLINQYLRQLGQVKTPADIEILLNNTGKRVEDLGFSNLNFSRINVYLAILNLTRNPPLVRLLSPSNNLFSSINNWNFSCSNSGLNLTNTTFYLWNSTALIYNETKNSSGTFNTTVFNYTFNNETSYYWNCRGSNNNSIYSFASTNNTLTYDITAPSINLTSPSDGYAETASSSTLTFNYNVTDANNISNCSLIVNGAVNTVNLTINPSSITSTFVPGNYNWSVNCSDNSGNIGNSSNRSFTITAPVAVCTNCGGGGGG